MNSEPDEASPDAIDQDQPQSSAVQAGDHGEPVTVIKHPGRVIRFERWGRSFLRRHKEEMLRDLFVGLCVGGALSGVAFLLTATFQNELEHQEILDNTLFTRQLSLTDGPKPLSGLNLRETELPNLDLSGANLARADLTSADLHGTDLRDANLSEANLHAADLTYANLFNSLISGANFTGADLTGANLEGLVFMPNLGGICYDDSTVWPEDFEIELPSSC